ncbi:hypothetical protein WR25_17837 [Diploscapter pachys]|uniref:Uncharacterized protein n=1 Tax=Diploscapter pachys TaxID=2018661 RepID=A0A2A2M4T7_9BILA|nr:hypothetical protein WR25_17837 [Diploscapter pachys]
MTSASMSAIRSSSDTAGSPMRVTVSSQSPMNSKMPRISSSATLPGTIAVQPRYERSGCSSDSSGRRDTSAASTSPSSSVSSRTSSSGSPPLSSALVPGTKVTVQSPGLPRLSSGSGTLSHISNRSSKSSIGAAAGAAATGSGAASTTAPGVEAATRRASIGPSAGASPPSRAAAT